jgi:RsiW-degrading membrane proteinase PrsW (M82 family)
MPVYTLTILVAAALVLWVYQHDRYEKEPWWAVLAAVAVGFGAMWLIGFADDGAMRWLSFARGNLAAKAIVVALIEELGKLFTILLLARVILARQFNDPMDGLIYGRLVGLGMAVEESLLYVSLAPPTLETLGVEIVRLFAHSLMAALIGFAIGLGCAPAQRRECSGPLPRCRSYPGLVVACLLLSTLLHFGWNVIAYARPDGLVVKLIPMMVMLALMVAWRWLCNVAESRSRAIFDTPAVAAA